MLKELTYIYVFRYIYIIFSMLLFIIMMYIYIFKLISITILLQCNIDFKHTTQTLSINLVIYGISSATY